MSRAACTIVSPNYIAFARTLAASYLVHHPGDRFFVLIVADLHDSAPFGNEVFTPVMLDQIGLPDLRNAAMKYEILELNTNVKPTFMKFLLEQYGLDALVYLDPDIFVYAALDPVFAALDRGAAAVLTPHMTTPVYDGHAPSEQDILYNGTYNLGFIAVDQSAESAAILNWWERRCLDLGFSEGRTGLFVDQKWMNLAPGLFPNVAILRDPGCNMAYWNLHERALDDSLAVIPFEDVRSSATGSTTPPLRFFHFSGITLTDPANLSKNTDRFTLADRPDLQQIFAAYKAAVLANKDPQLEALPYGFNNLSDGTALNRLARRIYAVHAGRWAGTDPFDADGPFAAFAKRRGLVERGAKAKAAPVKATWSDFNKQDRRVTALHSLLKFTLRLLGPVRYELLMRYLAYITVLRNQAVFIDDKSGDKP